jgi:starch phosphorylase
MLLADYQAYVDCQQQVSDAYRDQKNWTRMSILNSARVGRFSSDRSIREYCRDIWNVSPITTDESEVGASAESSPAKHVLSQAEGTQRPQSMP